MPYYLISNDNTQVPAVPIGPLDSVFNGLVVSDTSQHNGQTWQIDRITIFQYQCIWAAGSGSPAGTFQAQESNDGGTTWTNVTSATGTVSGNSGSAMIKIVDCGASQGRVILTLSAGTVTISVRPVGKGF